MSVRIADAFAYAPHVKDILASGKDMIIDRGNGGGAVTLRTINSRLLDLGRRVDALNAYCNELERSRNEWMQMCRDMAEDGSPLANRIDKLLAAQNEP